MSGFSDGFGEDVEFYMVKNLVNELRYSIYGMSILKKVFFITYILIFGILLYHRGLENIFQDFIIFMWIPASIVSMGQEKVSEMYRLLPMDEWEFKVWITFKNLADGLVISFMAAVASIPCAIKDGRPMLFFKVMITILVCTLWFGECIFKYKKMKYPGIIFRLSELIIYIILVMLLTADIHPYSTILDIIICMVSVAVVAGAAGIRLYRMRNIPVSEMSFDITAEKR